MTHSHNIHILLGENAEQNISRIKEYVIKYGNEHVDSNGKDASEFLQLLIWREDGLFYSAEKRTIAENVFSSGVEDEFSTELKPCPEMPTEMDGNGLSFFFKRKFTQTVNVQNPGDGKLHVCIHVPIFDKQYLTKAEQIMTAIDSSDSKYTVDLVLIAADLAHIYINDSNELSKRNEEFEKSGIEILEKIVEIKTSRKYKTLNNAILISNKNENGIALDLNRESFTNIIGEYALATTSYYSQIFPPTFLLATSEKRPILGLGISMLHLDRFYFVQHMLHKAYAYILEREGIDREEVKINTIALIVKNILTDNINIFTTIFEQEVKPRLERSISQEQIRAELEPLIKEKVNIIKDKVLEYIKTDSVGNVSIGLPEKRVILAQMLGEDDSLFDGIVVDGQHQPIIDDCRQEALDMFVNANNKLAATDNELMDTSGKRSINSYAILSNGTDQQIETAKSRLLGVKEVRNKIRASSDYIRRSEKQLKSLEKSIKKREDSYRRLTEHGFEYDGRTYYLMPKNIEVPLDETYVPQLDKLPSQVDLRKQFTPIKDQQNLGACSAFALVSIYEYILKKNGHNNTCLSELFSYQNARIRQGKNAEDGEGTSLYDNVMGMGEKGICLNEIFPYVPDINLMPNESAYDDAQKRKITKALNVERNISHIKSAISQGYPVAISLSLYESFKSEKSGFVPHPGNEEFVGYHAMVVCGYSDKDKIFIVRNSWGEKFGDKGYCYIPYSYIGNTNFLHQACIITEISVAQVKVEGIVSNTPISFNEADSEVLAAKLRILIEEEKIYLEEQRAKLNALRENYIDLVTKTDTPGTQETITNGTKELLTIEVANLEKKRQELITERGEKLTKNEKDKKFIWKYLGIAIAPILLIYSLLIVYIESTLVLNYLYTWGVLHCFQILGVVLLCSLLFINKKLKPGIPEDLLPVYESNMGKMWKWWFIGVGSIIVLYLFLVIYKILPNLFSYSFILFCILTVLSFVPFVCMVIIHSDIGKDIDRCYKDKQKKIDSSKYAKEKELENLKTTMFVAGTILRETTTFILELNDKFSHMIFSVDNLKIWYNENKQIRNSQPPNKAPFMSLTNMECLDRYFDTEKNKLTSGIKLYDLLDKHNDMTEKGIIKLKNAIKETVKLELNKTISDFSIFDHITGNNKYGYVSGEFIDLDKLLEEMDHNSRIFVETYKRVMDVHAQSTTCKMLFREVPDYERATKWDRHVNSNFQPRPVSHDILSQYKVFIIRIEGLAKDEIAMLATANT